jgi:chemotaxis protein methyltransferase CheR
MSNRVEQVADHTPLVISDRDFHRLSEFVHQNYGIDLSQKQQLISGRLSTVVKQKGYKSFT